MVTTSGRIMKTRTLGRALVVVCLTAGAGGTIGGTDRPERQEYTEVHMGMRVRLVLYAADEPRGRAAARAAFDRVATLDRMMSDYRADSELSRLQSRPEEWVHASAELFAVMRRAVA